MPAVRLFGPAHGGINPIKPTLNPAPSSGQDQGVATSAMLPKPTLPPISGPPLPPEPGIMQEAANLASALAAWATAGFPVADAARVAQIKEVCEACPLWDGGARGGLGKCKSFKCGCTRFKWWIKTSKCPEGKW